ncbi:DNA-deoxyinosine glycosylase [Roseateles koreensis]|uniref:DNA-deoxyinosine glycosylase n=1 Tax=Roseateles koreensis TaxID=2987526 RepID=A0ABT5KWF7_9BURK|nr:DNA-deoxyinosine glycosylase [Roseateles koreensis]MDC8787275.1 DNA-deoxyinosine glycosylase [Roseateles koreensis]
MELTAPGERLNGLPPVWSVQAKLLVLGSFPSAASLASQRYYGHPRNQFWPILSSLWGHDLMHMSYAERLAFVCERGLAIWDVYDSCERKGSLDSAIQATQLNDLPGLAGRMPGLRAIAHNGGESARYRRVTEGLGLPVYTLPSTSPANASWSFERKLAAWREVFEKHGLLE